MAFGDWNGDGKVSLEETMLTYGMLRGLGNNRPARRGCCLLTAMAILLIMTAGAATICTSAKAIKKIWSTKGLR